MDRALAQRGNSAPALTARGLALMMLGHQGEAVASYEAALAADPNFAEAHNDLGLALCYAGQIVAARSHFERAVQIVPDDAGYRANLEVCERSLKAGVPEQAMPAGRQPARLP